MTSAFVVDASVAIGWVYPAQATPASKRILDAIKEETVLLEVPALWSLEVANALTVLVRRRRLTEDERKTALSWLRVLPVRVDHEMSSLAFSRLTELATTHHLSVYDAAYLELAQRRRLLLASNDTPLRKAARECGVKVWES